MGKGFPDVSIIVTNYNYGRYLDRCLRSCLKQEHVCHEVILVDDCSSDESDEVVKPFSNDITYIKLEKNLGVAHSSNVGISKSRGRFFIRVDADDYVNEKMCYFLETYLKMNRDVFCVSCDYILVDVHEVKLERKYAREENISCGVMYRKDLFVELGGYNEDLRHREEEELRKRLGDYYRIEHLGIPFYRYRMHDCNKTLTKEYLETKV